MRLATRIAVGVAALAVAIQLVPVSRTNPPVEADVPAPPEVKALLRRACYDCHSHETVWPLQARVAPSSWVVAHDVREGREELNFSRWTATPEQKRAKLPGAMRKEVVEKRDMPPLLYRWAHPGARLTDAERAAIAAWGDGLGAVR
jgi:hypothetical protein